MRLHVSASSESSAVKPASPLPGQRSPRWIRRVAYQAEVCERTVTRFIQGKDIRPSSRERIERALETMAADTASE